MGRRIAEGRIFETGDCQQPASDFTHSTAWTSARTSSRWSC